MQILVSNSKIVKLSSFIKVSCKKKKTFNFALKITYLDIFELEFEKTIVIFDANTFQFFNKNTLFEYLLVVILKSYCLIRNQHSRIRQKAMFHLKRKKNINIETKNALFGYFRLTIEKTIVTAFLIHVGIRQLPT